MKLRYQMRGLGIGIIVTALLMGVVKGEKVPLSDAEIKVRALELGMVESDSMKLSDIPNMSDPQGEQQEPDGESASGADEAAPEGNGEPETESSSGDVAGAEGEPDSQAGQEEEADGIPDAGEEAGSAADAGDEQAQSPAADGDSVTVVIEEGVTSYSVCKLLEELGLVEDADSLDFYICSNSYSRSIQEGTYEIPKGTGEEEIVRIIMGNR